MGYFFEHSCQKPEPSPIPQSSILGLRLALVRINTSVPGSEKTKQSRLIFQSETMLSRLKFATPSFGHCAWGQPNLIHLSICACHHCARAMLIFSVSFQIERMIPERNP